LDALYWPDLDAMVAEMDMVVLTCPRTSETYHLFSAERLARMKPTAYLINTSRGPIVDEAALIAAVEAGNIAGAGLDVFDEEPLPSDHPYRRIDAIVATPHLGYTMREGYENFFGQGIEDIAAWLDGKPIRIMNT
ncbi:MAG: D-2-hydroxyacid dehydrogenase family protein, partial [Rhodospirillales bacterium]|nr:D-2-hydroxyacid dehydrogenase family protein [Rhodospirillales bacterium]